MPDNQHDHPWERDINLFTRLLHTPQEISMYLITHKRHLPDGSLVYTCDKCRKMDRMIREFQEMNHG